MVRLSGFSSSLVSAASAPLLASRTLSKTQGISLITLQKLSAAPRQVISSVLNAASAFEAAFFIRMGRYNTSAFTASVNVRIEASYASSDNGSWFPVASFASALGSSIASQALTVASDAGATTLSMAATTNFAAGDIVYIDDTVDITKSEFARIASVSAGISITLEEGLTNAHAVTTTTVYDQAELYNATVSCTSYARLRVVIDGSGAAQNFVADAHAITGDSVI